MTFQSHMSIFSVELTLKRLRTRPGIYMIGYGTEKNGLVVQILRRTDRVHSKLVRDFSKKLLTGIFGCPKLRFRQKNCKKNFRFFFSFFIGFF